MKDWTVAQVKAETRPGAWRVSRNLYLQVEEASAGGVTKSWAFRYMRHGTARWHGLGSVEVVTLAKARDKVLACLRQLDDGIDPIEAKRAKEMQERLALASAGRGRQGCPEGGASLDRPRARLRLATERRPSAPARRALSSPADAPCGGCSDGIHSA